MYTYNSAFSTSQKPTPTRQKKKNHLEPMLGKYGLKDSRVEWWQAPSGTSKTYATEQAYCVRDFLKVYKKQFRLAHVVYSDGGAAFRPKGKSVVEEAGLAHVVFPAAIHQFLSPNDNSLHGVGKAKCRAHFSDMTDDVETSLFLLRAFDDVSPKTVRGWFKRNFLLGQTGKLEKKTHEIIFGPAHKRNAERRQCIEAYEAFIAGVPLQRSAIESHLDGVHWTYGSK